MNFAIGIESKPKAFIAPYECGWTNLNVPFMIGCNIIFEEKIGHTQISCPENTKLYHLAIDANAKCPDKGFSEGTYGEVACEAGQVCKKKACFYYEIQGERGPITESGEFKIDKVKPKIVSSIAVEERNGRIFFAVSASCEDIGSGCASLQYRTSEKARWADYSGPIKFEKAENIYFKAVDKAGNETLSSKALKAEPDSIKPAKPTSLTASIENGLVLLKWNQDSEEQIDVKGFQVTRAAGSKEEIVFVQQNFFIDEKKPEAGLVSYNVVAVDLAGNQSEASEISIKFLNSGQLTEISPNSGWYKAPLKVSLNCVSAEGCLKTFFRTNYGKWVEGKETEITAAGKHALEFYSTSKNNSAETIGFAWFGLDTEPPEVSDLMLTEFPEGVSLAWNSPPDKQSGSAQFKIYRNGVFLAETTEKNFFDRAIQKGENYEYGVAALDLAGNESKPFKKTIQTKAQEPTVLPYFATTAIVLLLAGIAIIVVKKIKNR
ncbi:MAG: hypothetical protein QXK06_05305 [Candidatus Diapherotrites archaeon]